jgi:hypothetical protein
MRIKITRFITYTIPICQRTFIISDVNTETIELIM